MIKREMTFLWELRDAARQDPRPEMRALLHKCANDLSDALRQLNAYPSQTRMETTNGLWSKGVRVLKEARIVPEPTPPVSTQIQLAA